MRAILPKDTRFQLRGRSGTFQILDVLGCGSSCVAYRAAYEDGQGNRTDCLLKEYNPAHLPVVRDEAGQLSTPQEVAFHEGLKHFRESCRLQEMFCQVPGLRNSTPVPGGLYDGLGTSFTVTPLYEGKPYSEIEDASLLDVLKTLKALATVIEKYHQAGYFHLDVKPANLFVFPETREHIILFDFDSVAKKDRVDRRTVREIRYTQEWAAPELTDSCRWESICPATDLFSLGEILFHRLMGRHSEIWECRSFSEYPQLRDVPLLKGHMEDGELLGRLTEFFQRTLCSNIKGRWQSASEVLKALDELIQLAGREYHLCTVRLSCVDFFLGRDRELSEIHEKLSDKPLLFLCGMGGIGKSELAKQYAMRFANDYDVVLAANFTDSLRRAISNDVKIANFRRREEETDADCCRRKLNVIGELCNRRVLLILDNLDRDTFADEEAVLWRQLLELNCTLLVTSRCNSWEYPKLMIGSVEKKEDLLCLFQYWSGRKEDAKDIEKIIEFFDGHTLAVELAAKQVKASALTSKEYLARLYAHGLGGGGEEPVRKDSMSSKKTAADHICTLFDMASLSEEGQKILQCMALLPPEGIEQHLFRDLCHLKNFTEISSLCDFSWLSNQDERLKIHPLVAQVVMLKGGPAEVYDDFLPELREYLILPASSPGAVQIGEDGWNVCMDFHTACDTVPIVEVEGGNWQTYVASWAAHKLSQYPKLVSSAIVWFFEATSWLILDAGLYLPAQEYGQLAFKTSTALNDGSKTTLDICDTMEGHWAAIGRFSEERWYWEQEEKIWRKLGIPEGFYLAEGRFFLDHDEYVLAEDYFKKEQTLYGESPGLSYLFKELTRRKDMMC